MNLLNGNWPVVTYPQTQAEAFKPPTIQTVITEDVANGSGLKIGDQLQDSNEIQVFDHWDCGNCQSGR